MNDDLRRITRVTVCCRVVVADRYGVWTGITENVSARGCLIVTSRLLRPGTKVHLTLSSDLFPEEFEVLAEVVWATPERLGVSFVRTLGSATLAPEAWLARVIEFGALSESSTTWRVAPSMGRATISTLAPVVARGGLARTPVPRNEEARVLPFRR